MVGKDITAQSEQKPTLLGDRTVETEIITMKALENLQKYQIALLQSYKVHAVAINTDDQNGYGNNGYDCRWGYNY
jgi:hypothetical protein